MNAKQRRDRLLGQLETLARYSMGLNVVAGQDAERDADLEYLEGRRKVHRAAEGDGWTYWKAGKA